MGSTPRQRVTQLPLPTRSTEASTECFGRIVLSYLREPDMTPASFFILGDLLHRAIEDAILNDWDLAFMATSWIDKELPLVLPPRGTEVIESSQRGMETIFDDYQRMIKQWFERVHPDSSKRHPIYDEYVWPPRVEVEFHRTARSAGTKYPIWGSVDALFSEKDHAETCCAESYLIVDWKSGTQRQKTDFQLNYYKFGMDLTRARAAFHHLDRVQKRSIIQEADEYPGDDEIREAILLTERRKDAVLAGRTPRFVPDWYCGYCPAQAVCPADGDPRNREDNMADLKELLYSVEPMEAVLTEKGAEIGRVQ